ncbi:MAG: dienelactone hydrolase family protein [Planctomycetota bacterium]|nr:dienelactone hydrolase family protein [Planctomycetota bacterium]MDA1142016.1 dienelactone hydrolase family protein [Planctomycetota bacterium]
MPHKISESKFLADVEKGEVSSILIRPKKADQLLVLGHGSGSHMRHALVESLAAALAEAGVATFRYNYPYSEKGGGGLNSQKVLLSTVRNAVAAASVAAEDLPLFAGGHSMSGRMTSMAQAEEPLPNVKGIVFFAFPTSGKADQRTEHFADVKLPILFFQGTRDKLTPLDSIEPAVKKLGKQATLHIVDTADHSFKILKRCGKTEEEVKEQMAGVFSEWASKVK